jgi:hypothetical protein
MDHRREESQEVGEPEGGYANDFKVGHHAFEFLLDFAQLYAERQGVYLHIPIITNPMSVKAFFETLQESINQDERIFGAIQGG